MKATSIKSHHSREFVYRLFLEKTYYVMLSSDFGSCECTDHAPLARFCSEELWEWGWWGIVSVFNQWRFDCANFNAVATVVPASNWMLVSLWKIIGQIVCLVSYGLQCLVDLQKTSRLQHSMTPRASVCHCILASSPRVISRPVRLRRLRPILAGEFARSLVLFEKDLLGLLCPSVDVVVKTAG